MKQELKIAEKLEICDLDYTVGPSGSSEAVGAAPCALLFIVLAVYRPR